MAAGLLMAIASATLKAAVDSDPTPRQVADQLNQALFRAGGHRAFMAVFYGLLDPDSGGLDFICAGQPFPLLLRAAGGIEELGEGALPLGMRERTRPSAATVALERGDRLVLFTDGLAEAVAGPDDEAFGYDRIRQLAAAGGSAREIHDRILAAFEKHVAGQPLADDLTLVVIARDG
jgi:sigma-B regulation protein RsbU (phosphoserine phosphatase)